MTEHNVYIICALPRCH